MIRRLLLALAISSPFGPLRSAPLELKSGDHIAIIGNTLADRQQHHGWLETMIYKAHPTLDLTVRNLAFSADEVAARQRSENFGSPDSWLEKVKADVIFAYFGFNESFKGPEGLAQFKSEVDRFLKDTKSKRYNGKSAPKIVLISPIAHEDLKDPNFGDGAANNERLRYYAETLAEVARANDVQFVDLFGPSRKLYTQVKSPLTFNGVHLTEAGDRQLAPLIFQGIFGREAPSLDDAAGKNLLPAVLEKDAMWHSRYRTVDGYNVYGGRSQLKYNDITNYKVMQEEMSVRDVMTQNRDKKIWAVARGADPKTYKLDDTNAPPITEVPTNKPDARPFLDPEEAIKHMTVPKGVKVQLFASEKEFPELVNPVQMAWDTKGRLWVSAWLNYPERTPWSKEGDKLLVLEDTNHDGRADKCTTFLGDLNCPTGFQFYKDGVLVMRSPELLWIRDTDGDGKGDREERVLSGLDAADSHHETNSMCREPGGAVYCSDGVFHRTQVETPDGPVRNQDGCIYRYEPNTAKFERYMAYNFANPHGRVFDYWGNDIITDATGNNNYFGPASTGFLDEPQKHSQVRDFWQRPSRPCAGTGILSSRAWPDDFNGNFLNANVISIQGIFRVKVIEDGSGLRGETLEHLVTSDDPNFRPSGVSVAPDGSVYFMDWSNAIIGHMQHHLRDPNRDHEHGRVYRMTFEGRELLKPPPIHGQPIPALLDALKTPEDDVRLRAKIELEKHHPDEVAAAAKKWAAALDTGDKDFEHHRLEALWVHQWNNRVDLDLLRAVLRSPEPRARAQAVRVLCYWRDRVPDALSLLKAAAADAAPRVRLEAVRACSFFRQWEAADVALTALAKPTDYYVDYCLKETLKQLEQWWKPAIGEGKPLAAGNPAGIEFVLGNVAAADLAKLPRTEPVLGAILTRPGLRELDRLGALAELAAQKKTSMVVQLLAALEPALGSGSRGVDDMCRLLSKQPAADLQSVRDALVRLSGPKAPAVARAAARAGLALADGSLDAQWKGAESDIEGLTDLLRAVPAISDPTLRATAYPKVKPLLTSLPAPLEAQVAGTKGIRGRYVRIELPRRGTLTLAEVEVVSDDNNVARKGKATQSSTTNHGDAVRAIDGNTNGTFGVGSQTHTRENENQPWWEVDLQNEYPLEVIKVWNRTEDELGKRLEGFTLTIFDGNRREVLRKTGLPAPAQSAQIVLESDPVGPVRRAAIAALVSTGVEQATVFTALSEMVRSGTERTAATLALAKLPRTAWDKSAAGSTALSLVEWAKSVPAADRTSEDYLKTTQIAADLAGLLPADQAASARKSLRDLSVAVSVVKTVREQLRYDTPRLVVEAGKPFEIIFVNDDVMPHNLLIVKPGAKTEIGLLTATMPPTPDSEGRAYVPKSDKVLAATKLLEPDQRATLKMTAPADPGNYEYVCTFPGHWTIMNGLLVVTRDIEAYLKANPIAGN